MDSTSGLVAIVKSDHHIMQSILFWHLWR